MFPARPRRFSRIFFFRILFCVPVYQALSMYNSSTLKKEKEKSNNRKAQKYFLHLSKIMPGRKRKAHKKAGGILFPPLEVK